MKKTFRILWTAVMMAAIALSVFTGCAVKDNETDNKDTQQSPVLTGENVTSEEPAETAEPEQEEKAVFFPKSVTYYDSNNVFASKSEYEYDTAGNKTGERSFEQDENGNQHLSYMIKMEYDKDGNLIGYQSYDTDAEEPFVDYELKDFYENGAQTKTEYYHLVDGEFVLFSYYDFENDSQNRIIKEIGYDRNDETGEFEKTMETVYEYKGDFEQPVLIRIEQFGENRFFDFGTMTAELDEQGREIMSEFVEGSFGMRTVTEYDGDFVSKETDYVFDEETGEWVFRYTKTFSYNSSGNKLEESTTYDDGDIYRVVYEYDESGEKLLKELYYETNEETGETELYEYAVYEY